VSYVPYDMYADRINRVSTIKHFGKITQVVGLVIESAGPAISIGRLCNIENHDGSRIQAEVVGFRDDRLLLMPYGPITGINPGAIVTSTSDQLRIPVGDMLIGRVLGGLGQPIDGKGTIATAVTRAVSSDPIPVLKRTRITDPVRTKSHRHYGHGWQRSTNGYLRRLRCRQVGDAGDDRPEFVS